MQLKKGAYEVFHSSVFKHIKAKTGITPTEHKIRQVDTCTDKGLFLLCTEMVKIDNATFNDNSLHKSQFVFELICMVGMYLITKKEH